ncbi:5-deoxy-glucuronate isomerase [Candidatus Nomurabacteria bacterium]|nr:5-deoxy-glucuronate isomerase [Candidatus Nomurabacteria bacterium]
MNEIRLDNLCASGNDEVLVFESLGECAKVYLKGNTIERVVFTLGGEAPVTIESDSAQAIVVGNGNTQRDVFHYIRPGGPAPTLRLGITVHRGEGSWSSLPHNFELNTESGFEEVFFYLLENSSRRGIQVGKGVWFDNTPVDTVWPIKDRAFGTVPMGYHPVVGEPGVKVSYVWAYLAKKKEWEKVRQ